MHITGWDVLIYTDGTASLVLYGRRAGDAAPPCEPVGPMPPAEARRMADWLRKGGATDSQQVRERLKQLPAAWPAAR